MKLFASALLINICVSLCAMDCILRIPSKKNLEEMLLDMSLSLYISEEVKNKFYDLAEKEVQPALAYPVIRSLYSDFRFKQATNQIPKQQCFQHMGIVISIEYANLVKAFFTNVPTYWKTIENEVADEVRAQGHTEFTFFNFKEKFYGSLLNNK